MKHIRKGGFSSKHSPEAAPDPRIADAIRTRKKEEGLPCAVAFSISEDLNLAPLEVGKTADLLEISIITCQLGLFGYHPVKRVVKPADHVSEELNSAIRNGLVNDRLPCKTAWDIARSQGMPKMAVSAACEKLGIKIKPCQLGSF